jgi:hypothetical protein
MFFGVLIKSNGYTNVFFTSRSHSEALFSPGQESPHFEVAEPGLEAEVVPLPRPSVKKTASPPNWGGGKQRWNQIGNTKPSAPSSSNDFIPNVDTKIMARQAPDANIILIRHSPRLIAAHRISGRRSRRATITRFLVFRVSLYRR